MHSDEGTPTFDNDGTLRCKKPMPTCILAYKIGIALGDYPVASMFNSGLVTTLALGVVFIVVRHHRRHPAAQPQQDEVAPTIDDL